MKRRTALLVLGALLPALLFGAIPPSARVIPLTSPIYEQVDTLYRLSALALPSASRPWSTSEARQIVNALDPQLPGYEALASQVAGGGEDLFKIRGEFAFAAEGYLHTNTAYNSPYHWIYSIDERRPFLRFTWDMSLADRFYAAMGIDVAIALSTSADTPLVGVEIGSNDNQLRDVWSILSGKHFTPKFAYNLLTDKPLELSGDWPHASQISLAGPWWSASVGRGAVQWGSGISGNLILGSHIRNHNYLDLSFFGRKEKLQVRYLFLPNTVRDNKQKIFLGFRLEFSPWRWIRFALSENAMFKGENIILHYLDPTYFYHNFYDRDHLNSIAGIEMDLAIARGLSFHAQIAIDQYQLHNEGNDEADAIGYLANLAYSWQDGDGLYTFTVEGAYTDPVLYRRDKVDFLVLRGTRNNREYLYVDYLGYRYGGDSITATARLSYLVPSLLRLEGSIALHCKGEVDFTTSHNVDGDNTSYANIRGPAPSGESTWYNVVLGFTSSWTPPIAKLEFYTSAHLISRLHYHRPSDTVLIADGDLQIAFGISKTFF